MPSLEAGDRDRTWQRIAGENEPPRRQDRQGKNRERFLQDRLERLHTSALFTASGGWAQFISLLNSSKSFV